jgi:hypothetical protein
LPFSSLPNNNQQSSRTNNNSNHQFHRLALELSLPGTNSALDSALQLHDLTQPPQSIRSIPTSSEPSPQSPRGDPPIESPRCNTATYYYSMPLPNLPSPPLSSHCEFFLLDQ